MQEAQERGQGGRGPLLVVEGRKQVLKLNSISDSDLCQAESSLGVKVIIHVPVPSCSACREPGPRGPMNGSHS